MHIDDIKVGMGATLHDAPHCYPFTIIKILNEKRVVVQEDVCKRIDNNGSVGPQVYEYLPNHGGKRYEVSFRKNGKWVQAYQQADCGRNFYLGKRRRFNGANRMQNQ